MIGIAGWSEWLDEGSGRRDVDVLDGSGKFGGSRCDRLWFIELEG